MSNVFVTDGTGRATDGLPASGLAAIGDLCGASSDAAAGTRSIRFVTEPVDLVCVFEPEVQVVVLRREPHLVVQRSLDSLAQAGGLGSGFRISLPARAALDPDALPDLLADDAMKADIALLLDIYADLVGCSSLGLRVEITKQAMCPRFHVDRVGIRLLCTYRGPTTEWLEGEWVDRTKLGGGASRLPDEASGLMRDPAGIGHAAPFDIVLLKGCAWPGNELHGAIHRSPSVPTHFAPRVLLGIDALWIEP